MAFDYNSRTRWEKQRIESWKEKHSSALRKLTESEKELYEEICNFSKYSYYGFPGIQKWYREILSGNSESKKKSGLFGLKNIFKTEKSSTQSVSAGEAAASPSLRQIITENCPGLLALLIPKKDREDYEYLLDQLPAFQYTRATFRPTVRTKNPSVHVQEAFGLMQAYHVLDVMGVTPAQYLKEEMDPELVDFKRNDTFTRDLHMVFFDDVLAAGIDRGDTEIVEAVKDALLSDNNTVVVSVPIIRGIVKSKNTELHELLAAFLVAARLQEGVRQAVCENADCGTPEAFLTILKAIEDNGLLRFSAVKRALGTWTGIFNADSVDRVSDKTFTLVCEAVRDREAALQMTQSDDSVQIITGLWALGFYETEDAVRRMLEIAESGSKNQRLTISYYNRYVCSTDFSGQAARKILETYPDDMEMAAAFMPTYLPNAAHLAQNAVRNRDGSVAYNVQQEDLVCRPIDLKELFASENPEEDARRHYAIMKNLADSMKKRKIEYSPLIFPWYGAVLDKSDLTERMTVVAWALQDDALIDEMCVRLTDITDTYYNNRKTYVRLLLLNPRTKVQRDALLGYVADKESFTRGAAYMIVKNLPLTEEDYTALEKHLRLKSEDMRRNVIDILERQEEAGVLASIRRLLSSGQEQMRLAGLDMLKRRSEGTAGAGAEGISEKDKKDASGENPAASKPGSAGSASGTVPAGVTSGTAPADTPGADAVKKACAALLREVLPDDSALSDREKILYNEIAGAEDAGSGNILNTKGYGLYDPDADYAPAIPKADLKCLRAFFSLSKKELDQYFDRIREFILENGKREYTSANGDTQLLENGLFMTNYDASGPIETRYPFPELWVRMYETIIQDPKVFFNLYFAARSGFDETTVRDMKPYLAAEHKIFYAADASYRYVDPKFNRNGYGAHSIYVSVLDIIKSQQKLALPADVARAAVLYALELPEDIRWMQKAPSKYSSFYDKSHPHVCFLRTNKFRDLLSSVCHYENDAEFAEVFPILHQLDKTYRFEEHDPSTSYNASSRNILSIFAYVKAHEMGLISRDYLYRAAFEMPGLRYAVGELAELFRPNVTVYTLRRLKDYLPVDLDKRTFEKENRFYQLCGEIYRNIVNLVLNVELKRGDTPTVFSPAVPQISRIEGIPRLMEILQALGKETLDRNTYYYYRGGTSKKECLCHLLKVCWPLSSETADDLKKAVKENKVPQDRLIEVAMYAPQWLPFAEKVLGIEGFESGCYYFMAHMNERFDDRKKAMIARYTPLTEEELNNGCFDTNWFFEVYEKLGEKNFGRLYKAAKYIADGSKHTRARKYADAATGKVDRDALEKTIEDKRNKDLLMSYGLIPMKDRRDALHRYEFLQKFLKESKQFGAQRRQSEAQCVEYALKNMATTAGYADDLRLKLAMETELVTGNAPYFNGITIGDYEAQIFVDEAGKTELRIRKGGKALKSVPAPLKKDPTFLEIKEFEAKLRGQYSRCAAMFERAMEEEDAYSFGELTELCKNPVTAGILGGLVFVGKEAAAASGASGSRDRASDSATGASNHPGETSVSTTEASDSAAGASDSAKEAFDSAAGALDSRDRASDSATENPGLLVGTLEDFGNMSPALPPETELLVAHPVTLYRLGVLPRFQRLFFERQQKTGLKQPFKQVFREFYLKLPEEMESADSRLFAGHQIQPKKTIAALRGRRWVADYDEGLQKVFFRAGIAATIYALADWFSPADTESPTLEYVSFYDRKTYRQKKLSEVPDILYSEVMRDVDLAVSVAHVGGVDPEASHSTIEMRSVILAFNIELFGLTNVTLEGTHAFIRGTMGNYNVHLGSGVIHKESGGMIIILPVHSQKRGKIFLPFIDDDPKTAEILSKILLLAEDNKIKDPYILDQIRR